MTDKTLATFRIDPQDWEAFKNMAGVENSNASAVLNEFVRWYLAGNRINEGSTPVPNQESIHLDNTDNIHLDNIDERLETLIDTKLDERGLKSENLEERMKEHTAYLAHGLNAMLGELQAQVEELRGKLQAR